MDKTGNVSIKVNSAEYMPQEDKQSIWIAASCSDSEAYYFIVKMDIKNETDEEIRLSKGF